MEQTTKKVVVLSEVIRLLKSGYVRWEKDVVEGVPGSIQKHFDLTFSELTTLNKHPKVKGVKTAKPKKEKPVKAPKEASFVIEDDLKTEEEFGTSSGDVVTGPLESIKDTNFDDADGQGEDEDEVGEEEKAASAY